MNRLYQDDAQRFDRDHLHKPMGFTRSVEAYINAAHKDVVLLMRNHQRLKKDRGYGYTWAVGINHHSELTAKEIASIWQRVTRRLRRSLTAYFVREPSKENRVHYHLILSSSHTEGELSGILADAKPEGVAWHTWMEPVKNPWYWANYILKAKKAGIRNGRLVADIYAHDRLLFVPNLPFNKVGTIGKFWVPSKAALWNQIVENAKMVEEGLKVSGVSDLCEWLHGQLKKELTLSDIQRRIGLHARDEYVQTWIEKLRSRGVIPTNCDEQNL